MARDWYQKTPPPAAPYYQLLGIAAAFFLGAIISFAVTRQPWTGILGLAFGSGCLALRWYLRRNDY